MNPDPHPWRKSLAPERMIDLSGRRKELSMARHDVRFNIPERKLGKSDIEFTVYSDDLRLGVLKISKGALVWRSANKKRGHIELGAPSTASPVNTDAGSRFARPDSSRGSLNC